MITFTRKVKRWHELRPHGWHGDGGSKRGEKMEQQNEEAEQVQYVLLVKKGKPYSTSKPFSIPNCVLNSESEHGSAFSSKTGVVSSALSLTMVFDGNGMRWTVAQDREKPVTCTIITATRKKLF